MKQSVLHFKLRVLDLIEIFIRKQPKDTKILDLIEVLLEVIKLSHGHADEQALFERTLGIYKNKLCHLHEYPSGTELNKDYVHSKIEELIEMAKTSSSALFANYITLGVIYMIRVLRGTPEMKEPSPLKTRAQRKRRETMTPQVVTKNERVGCLNESRLVTCCSEALTEFMTKRSSHLQPSLFIEIIQRFPEIGWKLSKNLPIYINSGCNNFRKVKACEMLKILLTKAPQETHFDMISMSPSIVENLSKFFESAKDESFSLKARQFHDVVHLADIFVKEASKIPELKNSLDRDNLQATLKGSLDSPVVQRSPSLHSYCEKFIRSLTNFGMIENGNEKKKKKKQTS